MNCELCGQPLTPADQRFVRIPRPSDPSDYCLVMMGCPDCLPAAHDAAWESKIEQLVEEGTFYVNDTQILWLT